MKCIILLSTFMAFLNIEAQIKTTYKYDAIQRVTQVNFQDGGFETYTYDKVGNRKTFAKVVPNDTPPPSSVQNTDKQDIFKIYPNPTDGVFSMEGNLTSPSESVIKLYDISGREIKSFTIPKTAIVFQTIDITTVPGGNYLLVINYGDRKRSWNIIKQ